MSGWDEEAGELRPQRVRTTVGRIIFNQILPDRLRFLNRTMNRLLPRCVRGRQRLLPAARPNETAHLVDGIKSVGFHYATRGGMTIAVDDIEPARRRGCSRPRTTGSRRSISSTSAA